MARRWVPTSMLIALTLLIASNVASSTSDAVTITRVLETAPEALKKLNDPASPETLAANASDVAVPPETRFVGHAVLRVVPSKESDVQFLRNLFKTEDVDVWKDSSQLDDPAHFRVGPERLAHIKASLKDAGVKYDYLIRNIQEVVDAQRVGVRSSSFGWDNFYRIDAINAWMASLASQHSNVAALVDGGRTYEGRTIQGVRIAHSAGLPVLVLEGGIHAREWVSPATATYILHQLLTSGDPAVQRAARSFEWHIFPSVNPDGYEYTHTTDRLWRKTRSRTTINCFGADPNRNWETSWGVTGVSWRPCSETFPGIKAMSEVETRTRARYMEPLLGRMKAFIALHSYGQYVLTPWGFTHAKPSNYDELLAVGLAAAQAIRARSGRQFRVGNLADTLYEASGSSMDWALANGARFSYTIELRDTGEYGFLVPASQITAAAVETTDGVMAIVNEILKRISAPSASS